jgi:hypothetical protein
MFLNNQKNIRNEIIFIFLQTVLLTSFTSISLASPACYELIIPLAKKNDSLAIKGGLWGYFEKDSYLRQHSTQAIQLDSRINKIILVLNYLCKTKNGVPLNDLAMYISRHITENGEAKFKAELFNQGKTSTQIKNWLKFFSYAQNNEFRTLELAGIQNAIKSSIPLVSDYVLLTKNITRPNSSEVILKKAHSLLIQIDSFLSTDPYITQALNEISLVPYWDINESVGGS